MGVIEYVLSQLGVLMTDHIDDQNGQEVNESLPATQQERITELENKNEQLGVQNGDLRDRLRGAQSQLLKLREEIDKMEQPPAMFGVFIQKNEGDTIDIVSNKRRIRTVVAPNVDVDELRPGQTVLLNEALVVIGAPSYIRTGEICTLREVLEPIEGEPDRAIVLTRTDEMKIVLVAGSVTRSELKPGDMLLGDLSEGFIYERIPKPDAEQLVLEEVPDISYEDIGGLASQIEKIRDAVELPYLHADKFQAYKLSPPKGVLLYGPPGCGKTLIAKAVANSLAKKVTEVTGDKNARAFFLNIKGPELLNKYVGETERHIREVFQRAREKASEGMPVIVFFDEMESLFRTHGTGISSDMESTIVPQLLSEIDGVEGLKNVLVIGASNREDMIDPAVLRPGRLDVKIKVERPDQTAASDIFSKYLTTDLPLSPKELERCGGDASKYTDLLIREVARYMYAETDENRFLEVTYQSGKTEILYFKDFNSGAMIENIVSRAKKYAIKEAIGGGEDGLKLQHLLDAVKDEFTENEDLPNTTSPDDWARISGKKGEKIVYIRTLITNISQEPQKPVENHTAIGQYL